MINDKRKKDAPLPTETPSALNHTTQDDKPKKRKSQDKSKDDRTRNWTFVVYPTEGNPPAPANWRDILDEEHIQWIESPLHDKDIDPSGKPKKPHIHVLVMYAGNKTYEQIKALTDALNAPVPQKAANVKGLVRYFTHMDNPEKAQYSKSDILCHGGADITEYFKASSTTRYQLIREMIEWVKENHIVEFCDLADYAMTEKYDDWFPLLCDNSAYIMGTILKSYRHRVEPTVKVVKVDGETGEILSDKK